MAQEDSLEKYLEELNNSIEELQKENKTPIDEKDVPSNLKIILSGVSDSKALDFLFSSGLDNVLEKLFDLITVGNLNSVDASLEQLNSIFEKIGLGEGSFEGPVSKTFVVNMQRSLSSNKFNKIKNKFLKASYFIKDLKRQANRIDDKEMKAKYLESVYAFKKVMRIAAKIYKMRHMINKKVRKGLYNIVHEQLETEE